MSLGQQHLHMRERLAKHLEPFPAPGSFKRALDYLMYGVSIVAPFALVPQVVQLYSTRSAASLSLTTWILLTFYNLLWALYGVVHRARPLLFANVLMFIFDLIIVFGILRY